MITLFSPLLSEEPLLSERLGPQFKSIQCGACHSLALTKSGSVYSWGKNSQGQCGLGHADDTLRPHVVTSLQSETIVQIAAGWEHSVARTAGGALYSWGCGYKDSRRGLVPPVLGIGSNEGRMLPEILGSLRGVVIEYITCGWDHCLACDAVGNCYSWGSGQNGKLGHESDDNAAIPLVISALEGVRIVKVSAGCEHSSAISDDGVLYTWGQGDGGRLGHGNSVSFNVPKMIVALSNQFCDHVYCGDKFTMALVSSRKLNSELKSNYRLENFIKTFSDCNMSLMNHKNLYLDELYKKSESTINKNNNEMEDSTITSSSSSSSSSSNPKISPQDTNSIAELLLVLMSKCSIMFDLSVPKPLETAYEYSYESSPYVFSCYLKLLNNFVTKLNTINQDSNVNKGLTGKIFNNKLSKSPDETEGLLNELDEKVFKSKKKKHNYLIFFNTTF